MALDPADLLISDQLEIRPRATADVGPAAQGMLTLARDMLDSPERLLKRLVELGVELCKAGSAGVSLLKTGPDGDVIFHWAALAGVFAPYEGGSTPRNFSPCGMCLDRGAPILLSYPARVFTYFNDVPTPIVEGLILPLYGVDRKPLGTIWVVSHDEGRKFDHGDVEIMQRLADFTALALEMAGRLDAQRRLAAELDHRVKNLLATVQSIVIRAQAERPSSQAFAEAVTARVAALARTHSLLSEGLWQTTALHDLLATLVPVGGGQLRLEGGHVLLQAKAAQALGMAFDELATNAAKHGALSLPGGSVRVGWRIVETDDSGQLELAWEENGGPPVQTPTRQGLGRSIIERGVPFELGGTVELHFRPAGLRCEMRLPLSNVIASTQ